ncbi:MAG: hypothetical protein GY822_14580 [Deltaproteobacteria bacterium]|nr:hypothetical protein [Deltaproteobacteria bacterium]
MSLPEPHFTTARVEEGHILLLDFHRERLFYDAALCHTSRRRVEEALEVARKCASSIRLGTLKIVVYADKVDVESQPLRRKYWQKTDSSLTLSWQSDLRSGLALSSKVLNRNEYSSIPSNALLEYEGEVREGPHFHVAFRFRDTRNKWTTPALAPGVLYGTRRAQLLQRDDWQEDAISVEDVDSAIACVALSGHLGVASVAQLGEKIFSEPSLECHWDF